jgi:hypothetical protein
VGGVVKCEGDKSEVTTDRERPSSLRVGGGSEGGGVTGRVCVGDGDLETVLTWPGFGSGDDGRANVREEDGVIVSLRCIRFDQKPDKRLELRP